MELAKMLVYIKRLSKARSELSKKHDELKAVEDQLRMAVYNSLVAANMQSTTISGVSRVAVTSKDHAEVVDYEVAAKFIFARMLEASKNGTPLSDALNLMQKSAKLDSVKRFKELGYSEEQLGISIKSKPGISITAVN